MTIKQLDKAFDNAWKEEEKFKDAGCPYFFKDDCNVEITETIFQKYCLRDFRNCNTYQSIIKISN